MMNSRARRFVAGSCVSMCAVSSPAIAEGAPPQVEPSGLYTRAASANMVAALHETINAG